MNSSELSLCPKSGIEGPLAQWLYPRFYTILLAAGLVGNSLCIVLYRQPYLSASPAIRLFAVKAVANCGFLLALFPNFLSHTALEQGSHYWEALPWVMFSANLCSTVSVWMTVAVGLEQLALVLRPLASRTLNQAHAAIVVVVILAAALQVYPVLTMEALPCLNGTYLRIRKEPPCFQLYHRISLWLYISLVLLIPFAILLCVSIGLWRRLFLKSRFRSGGGEREIVMRLALATTGSHLLLEIPGIVAGVFDHLAWWKKRQNWLFLMDAANFASLTNAALPFFLFMVCSLRFRALFLGLCCPCVPEERKPRLSIRRPPQPLKKDGKRRATIQTMNTLLPTPPILSTRTPSL